MSSIDLSCMVFNAENLFLLSDQELKPDHLKLDPVQWRQLSTSIYENKPVKKLNEIANIITKSQIDIVLFCEVGGLESLNNFNRLFLKNQYSSVLVEGNSDRNIDVGYLVKKDLGFYFDLVSNKNFLLNFKYPQSKSQNSEKFSRDVAELHLFTNNKDQPFLVFLLTHLKSRLDPQYIDPNGFLRRQAELKSLIEIYNKLDQKFLGKVPIVVAGDFNGHASKDKCDPEFTELYQKTALLDALELAQVPHPSRSTYFQTNKSLSSGQNGEGKQIDYAFLSPAAQKYLDPKSVQVYRYKDDLGQDLDFPHSMEDKEQLPSDHYPVLFKLMGIPLG